jgi:hypothetical protein
MRRLASLLLLLISAGLAWSGPTESPLRRYAFVTGSNDGGEGLERLKYAESDARAFATVMQDLGGIRPQDLVLVVNPGLQKFQDGLARIRQLIRAPREIDERRELIIYYSGHSDDDGLILGRDRVTWDSLRNDIADIPADVKIAILDSCSSGSLTRAKGGVSRPAFLFDVSSDMTGHAYLTSASAEEAAQESDRIGGSFFTHFLISGLRGAADAGGDGLVTLDEAYTYAYQETLASTEKTQYGPQHPAWEIELSGSGSLVLTDLRTSGALLTVADDVTGRLYIRDSDGNLAVELNKQYGQAVELGLEPGTYSVVLDAKAGRMGGEVRVTARQPATLTLAQLRPVEVEKATARGGEPAGSESGGPVEQLGARIGATIDSAIGNATGAEVGAVIDAVASAISAAAEKSAKTGEESPQQAPPPPAQPLPSPEPRARLFSLGLFPDLGAGVFSSSVDHIVALNVLVGISGSSLAFELGGLANFESGKVTGFQAAGLVNGAKGDLTGFQAAGLVNYVGGNAAFFQTAGLVNYVGGDAGLFQTAGLGNIVAGQVNGAQIAGIVNWAGRGLAGAQIAGVVNWGADVKGPQISVVNIGGTVAGAQIGVVNIAQHITGTQIGILNISQEMDGLPIGLLNIEARGRHDVDLWYDLDGSYNAAFSLGTRYVYSIVSAGWRPGTTPPQWSAGLGLGGRSTLGPFFLDYDASMVAVQQGVPTWTSPVGTMFPRARIVFGLPLFGGDIAIEAGASVRILVPYLSTNMPGAVRDAAVFQPSFIVGVHL